MISHFLAILVLSWLALGAVTPTAPGPGEVFTAGSKCSVSWTTDQSGTWKSFSIDLMSGSNSNMTLVTNVAEDLDGTDLSLSPFTWTCPDVDPYSTIYFYQFNTADKSNPTWTTRFTIASSAGGTTVPSHNKQPNGDEIPWGIGVMRSGSLVTSREKDYEKASAEENDSDEDDSSSNDETTSQRSGNDQAKGRTYDDDSEGVPSTRTSSRQGGSASIGVPSEDSDDFGVSKDDETTSTTSKSSKSSLTEDDSNNSDATDSKSIKVDGSPASAQDEPELENTVFTSSRIKTVHSKPTSTPFSADNINAVTPTLSLPSPTLLSAQPVGCAGGINATSSYCSAPTSANHATDASKLDSRTFFTTALLCLFVLL